MDFSSIIKRAERNLVSPFRLVPPEQHDALARALSSRPSALSSGSKSATASMVDQILEAGKKARGEVHEPQALPAGLAGDIIRAARKAAGHE